jgi:hypothetical protein
MSYIIHKNKTNQFTDCFTFCDFLRELLFAIKFPLNKGFFQFLKNEENTFLKIAIQKKQLEI